MLMPVAAKAPPERWAKTDSGFEGRPASGDQVVAGITGPAFTAGIGRIAGCLQDMPSDVDLRQTEPRASSSIALR